MKSHQFKTIMFDAEILKYSKTRHCRDLNNQFSAAMI